MSLHSLGPQPTEVCPVSAAWCRLNVARSCVCPGSGGSCGFVPGCLLPRLLPTQPRTDGTAPGFHRFGVMADLRRTDWPSVAPKRHSGARF